MLCYVANVIFMLSNFSNNFVRMTRGFPHYINVTGVTSVNVITYLYKDTDRSIKL